MAICCLPFISGCKQSECAVEENLISDALYRNLPFEMPKVQQPAFPAYEVNIEKFGAKGDGLFLNTKAINDAIKDVNQQEVEKVCTACGQTGGGNCPDCGAVMGDATYQETFDEEYQVEVQEDDPEKMEGAEHPHKENTGGNQHHDSDNETGETADHSIKVNGHQEITSTSRTCDHLMIDLETMGKNPDAPIISIGAIFFDPQTGDMGPEFSKTIDLETAGGVIDRDTIKWWLKQSREAQSAIMTDEIQLDDALLQLREFIDENSGEFFVQVWGNGANFDNTILRRSYERQGIPCPWRYYNDRDVRTIVELGKAIDFDARTAIPFEGERHNALDDARYQAKYVSAIWQKLIPSQADS